MLLFVYYCNKMISVDIDNFMVIGITNRHYYKKWISIKNVNFLPKEISNCKLLTYVNLNNAKIKNILPLSNCKLLSILWLYNNKIKDASTLSKCTSLTFVDLSNNNIKIKPIFSNNINIFLIDNK